MNHGVLGTAGHIDHGKTRLTLALTGKDTDRLAEERRRGVTIENGFALLSLPNGQSVSIVDVPGHERFIRNMLAGATGVDAALLVVAADEGWMPQTEEHVAILSLLCVESGLVAVTKADLVGPERLREVAAEISAHTKGTFLENAPVLPVSAVTGQGVAALKANIAALMARLPERSADRPMRLPVDRVFTLSGHGLIVTGTLTDGALAVGDSLTLYPQGKPVRVRELQTHDATVPRVHAGMRAAVNLTGVEKSEVARGSVLAAPGSVQTTSLVTVRLTVSPGAMFRVKNASLLHFYQGTQERLCRVRLLDADELAPGEAGYAQMQFTEPLCARNTDRFIVRFFSPVATVGGGEIVETETVRQKRGRPETLSRLTALCASPEARIAAAVRGAGCALVAAQSLETTSGLPAGEVRRAVDALLHSGAVIKAGDGLIAADVLAKTWQAVHGALVAYHTANPHLAGMPLGQLRETVFTVPQRAADAVLDLFVREGQLAVDGPYASLTAFAASLSPAQRDMRARIAAFYEARGCMPPTNEEAAAALGGETALYGQMFRSLCADGTLVRLTERTAVHGEAYRAALALFTRMFDERETVTLAEFRTALCVSRKVAQTYLELFDRQRISRLVGEARILLKRPAE